MDADKRRSFEEQPAAGMKARLLERLAELAMCQAGYRNSPQESGPGARTCKDAGAEAGSG